IFRHVAIVDLRHGDDTMGQSGRGARTAHHPDGAPPMATTLYDGDGVPYARILDFDNDGMPVFEPEPAELPDPMYAGLGHEPAAAQHHRGRGPQVHPARPRHRRPRARPGARPPMTRADRIERLYARVEARARALKRRLQRAQRHTPRRLRLLTALVNWNNTVK